MATSARTVLSWTRWKNIEKEAMSVECCAPQTVDPRMRRALWIALVVNALMFAVEIGSGLHAESSALLADAADFLGDAANYGISLWVLPLGLAWRARAAQLKAVSMCVYGGAVLLWTIYSISQDVLPE